MKSIFTSIFAVAVGALFSSLVMPAQADPAKPFTYNAKEFLLHGKPYQVISGEIHPQRIPRAYWRDRLQKARAMGLNTVSIYVFWNLLEPEPDKWDFSGNNDIAQFVRDAQQEGLHVVLRPGPYVCAEWEFGGYPAWLLKEPDMKVRTRDPHFMKASANYLKHLGEQLAPLQITHGGPIIMVQVENEYGSFGSDHEYMRDVKSDLVKAGFDTTFFTADGPGEGMIDGGTLPGVLSAMNFGGGAKGAFEARDKYHPGGPHMCGEFWAGWFDHWGEQHHTTSAEAQARELDWMLSHGASVNIYMFDGGTNFGFMNGANGGDMGGAYNPTTTSYDYDAPISEGGEPTKKFTAFHDAILKNLAPGTKLPPLPAPIPRITLPKIHFGGESASLFANLPKPVKSDEPLTMEQLDQSYGFTLYRTKVAAPLTGVLRTGDGPRDRVIVFIDGKRVGVLDRRYNMMHTLKISIPAGATLDLLVENLGRINFGRALMNEQKGILGKVTVGGKELTGWEMYPLPMTDLNALKFAKSEASATADMPTFYRAKFTVSEIGDTYLDMKGWDKGVVWVNGHNLGRYWHIGPQQALYLPGCWLKKGENTITVFSLDKPGATVSGIKEPYFETHSDAPPRFPGGEKYKADLTAAHLAKTGTFAKGDGWQEIKFDKPTSGHFIALQSLSSYGNEPFSNAAELELTDAKGQNIPREKWKIVWADSEELQAENGSADNLIDNQPDTIWHTQWSGEKPPQPHEIVIDLGATEQIGGFRYLPRKNNHDGAIKDYKFYVW